MPTEDHFTHRFCDNYLEAGQGVVVRVVVLGTRKERTKYETGVGGATAK